MGNATQRRERHLAEDLQALSTRNPTHFIRVWNLYVKRWCEEVVARGRGLNRDETGFSLKSVYDVTEKAERLLKMIGAEAERLVGAHTRQILSHECSKVVAKVTDPRMYLLETDSVYRLMMTKASGR